MNTQTDSDNALSPDVVVAIGTAILLQTHEGGGPYGRIRYVTPAKDNNLTKNRRRSHFSRSIAFKK